MRDLYKRSLEYIRECIGDANSISECVDTARLPLYLKDRYQFYLASLMGRQCLIAVSTTEDGGAPAAVRKQLAGVGARFGEEVVYVVQNMKPYNRKRFIEQRVPFVVPGRQLYLPGFGINLHEQFKQRKSKDGALLSAVSQLFVIRQIYHRDLSTRKLSEWAAELGYSAMTISRTVDELADSQLVSVRRDARSKFVEFRLEGRALWEAARHQMKTPVKRSFWVEFSATLPELPRSGQSALADYTMLAAPSYSTLAVYERNWANFRKQNELSESHANDQGLRIELWRYEPTLIKKDDNVDELSLWLSVSDDGDERVSVAKESLLERVPW